MVQPMVRPRTSRQLWDGVKMIGPNAGTRDGWPVGDGCQARRGNDAFTVLLKQARVDGLAVSRERWVEALQQSYPGVTKRRAVEWWDGAPTDVDRHGTILVHVWPGAEHRTGGGNRVLGRRPVGDEVAAGEEERRREAGRWSVSADGDLLIDGAAAEGEEADGVPCIKLLVVATKDLKVEGDAEVDRGAEVTISGARVSGRYTSSQRGARWKSGRSYMRGMTYRWRRRQTGADSWTSTDTGWRRQRATRARGLSWEEAWTQSDTRAATSASCVR